MEPLLALIAVAILIYGLILIVYPNPRLVILNAAIKVSEIRADIAETRKYIRFYGLGAIAVGIFLLWVSFYGFSAFLRLFQT
ncbi:MAG: hypothetical protein ACFFDI_28105 [Promethearchaeota archaeon]